MPGQNDLCVNGPQSPGEFVIDSENDRQHRFDYFAFGENTPGASSQDSGILVYVDDEAPYSPNPPCP